MCDEGIYTDPEKSKEVHAEYESVKEQLENLYIAWEENF